MSKRTLRAGKALLWLAALAVCVVSATMLVQANKPAAQIAQQPLSGEPEATGSIQRMRWCGAASWCR